MSAFDDFNSQGLSESFDVYGPKTITIDGEDYDAVIDRFSAVRELEMGGFVGEYDVRAVLKLADLTTIAAPIERTLEGKTATVDGRTFRIDGVEADEVSVMLLLNNPKKLKR